MKSDDLKELVQSVVQECLSESQASTTMSRAELKAIIKETLRLMIREMTTTGAVDPINLSADKKPTWVSGKGGSARGVAGSASLGYELTAIGKKDMARNQDPVY